MSSARAATRRADEHTSDFPSDGRSSDLLVAALADETGATLLMVSHEPGDARRIADDVILVADGVAHAPVPTAEIFAHPPEALRDYLGH